METSGEQPRRTSRVRKTPTKFSQDFDILDISPTPKAWDEQGLRAFYDSVVQHGPGDWRKVCITSSSPREFPVPFKFPVNAGATKRSGASSVLGPPATSTQVPRTGATSGLSTAAETGVSSPATNPTSGSRKSAVRKPGSRTPVVPAVEPPAASKQGTKRNTPRRAANDMTRPGMGSPNHDGGPEMRAGPPTRRRRLDFSNMHESSPSLAFATGDSPYSKLDMLAAAASEAAGQVQTPAASDHSHEVHPAAVHGVRQIPHVPAVPGPTQGAPQEVADGFYTPRQTSTDGGRRRNRSGTEDGGHVHNSPGAGAAQRQKRMREHDTEACNGPAIDVQKREALSNANRPAVQAGANSGGRDIPPSSVSLASYQQSSAVAAAAQPHGHAVPPYNGALSERARRGMPGGGVTTPVRPMPATAAPQAPGSSTRKSSRKSPPERLPLHLMQHRAWLMPGCASGSNSQGGSAVEAATPAAGNGACLTADMGECERRLRHCLGLRARRWAMLEFLNPSIDHTFYEEGSMAEYLHSLGLNEIQSFSKADMSFIRRALGAPPRRFSASFVHSERSALHAHRARCRSMYEGRNASDSSTLPPGVPPQCTVGQTVVARHPMLRTLHDGNVLTVGASTYMVQFHRSELGVGKVPDTDLAPADSLCWTPLMRTDASTLGKSSSGGAHEVPQEIGEKDFGLMDKVTDLLTKKAKLLEELKAINNEAQEGQNQLADGCFDKAFQMKYANKVAEFKAVNSELMGSCNALRSRVEEVSSLQHLPARPAAAPSAGPPPAAVENVVQVASNIVEESMAEAATLVHNLFQQHHQKRTADAACTSVAAAAHAAATALPEAAGSGQLPQENAANENGKLAACNSGGEQESTSGAAPTPPPTAAACAALPILKQEAEVITSSVAATPSATLSQEMYADNPSSLALLVDDESLMHMSTKLTAMFIAIQRCAASCQDARTVQRALTKLVADLKPASGRNTAQYQLIMKNVGRLSAHLGAR